MSDNAGPFRFAVAIRRGAGDELRIYVDAPNSYRAIKTAENVTARHLPLWAYAPHRVVGREVAPGWKKRGRHGWVFVEPAA